MTLEFKVLYIDAATGEWEIRTYTPEKGVYGPIDLGIKLHLEEYRSWESDPLSPGNPLILGWGPFALARVLGANRLVAVFRSPMTMGLHVSTMGGAAWSLARSGVDALVVEGRSEDPAILLISGRPGGVEVRREIIDWKTLTRILGPKPAGVYGVKAMHLELTRRYGDFIAKNKARILTVGPASLHSRSGGIFSYAPQHGSESMVIDSASRGGAGSVMLQGHGVAALIVGGKLEPPRRGEPDHSLLNKLAQERLGAPYTKSVLATTKKYRYDPDLGTGGTFGVNYVYYRELVPMFGYNTIYYGLHVRLELHEMVSEYFWSPFQAEVFRGSPAGKWKTCGEPCPVACKKIAYGTKVDYEPFHALGPMIGVFRFRDALELVEEADMLGVDAIEAGHAISWIFELVAADNVRPEDAGIPFRPRFDPLHYNPARDSHHNAVLARKLLLDLYTGRGKLGSLVASEGLRRAATLLEEEGWEGSRDSLLYAAFGERGYMTPNYYWSPGMVAPLYILGRYWTNYTPTFQEPEDYARTSLKRAQWEYSIDNAGLCRFHRGWAEKILDRLYGSLGLDLDPPAHAKKMYALVAEYQRKAGAEPVPWESRKAFDLIATIAGEMGATEWARRIAEDPQAALEWWRRFKAELDKLLGS